MNTSPLITVGVIFYNAQNNVKKVITNIQQQTWKNLEIIAIDDHSSDMTWDILQEVSRNLAGNIQIHIYQNEFNSGAGLSRKRIIEESSGDYVVFFDDDDISLPHRIEQQYKRIISYKLFSAVENPIICHVSRIVRTSDDKEFYVTAMGCNVGIAPHGKDVLECILTGNKKAVTSYGSIGSGLLMANKKDFIDAGNFDPNFRRAQDIELSIRWAKMGAHFIGTPEPLMIQNMIITRRKVELEEKYVLMFLEKHREYLDKKDAYTFIINWVKAKYAYLSGSKSRFVIFAFKAFFENPLLFIQKTKSAVKGLRFSNIIKIHLKT